MTKNHVIPYNPKLKQLARILRKNSTLSEILLWKEIKNKSFGVQFHRQVPLVDFIVDFYCHELKLTIEIDGESHNGKEVVTLDAERQAILEGYGIFFLRFSDIQVKRDMKNVLSGIEGVVSDLLDQA